MTKPEELNNIKLNADSLLWQLRNFNPSSKKSEFNIDEAIELADAMQTEIMFAAAREEYTLAEAK